MIARILIISLLALVLMGCELVAGHACSYPNVTLSSVEKKKLEEIQINNEFMSGCITEKISEFCEDICQEKSNICMAEQSPPINYSQWLNIYEACMVK